MTVLMTGFPGFLASALMPGILRRSAGDATCLVQPQYADLAARRAEGSLPPTRLWPVACTWWKGTSPSQGLASTGAAWTT